MTVSWYLAGMLVTSSGGPIRSEKMDSSNNLTPLMFVLEPVDHYSQQQWVTANRAKLRQFLHFALPFISS